MSSVGKSREDVGRTNRRLVLDEIVCNGPVPRAAISTKVGLTNASVSRITRDFIQKGVITETDEFETPTRPGRRYIGLKVNPKFGCVLGIGINAFQQSITLADLANNVIARREFSLDNLSDSNLALDKICGAAKEVVRTAAVTREQILGCSVAITGSIDPHSGKVLSADPLGWKNVDIRSVLTESLQLEVKIENLPNAMNLAETQFGCAKDKQNVILISASLALGFSLIFNQQLFRGHDYSIGLLQNLHLSSRTNQTGKTVCVDELAGGRAILKSTGFDDKNIQAQELLRLMEKSKNGDQSINKKFYDAGIELHAIIETISTIIPAELVIVSGPLTQVQSYVDGLNSDTTDSNLKVPIIVSDITSQRAARLLAIRDFLTEKNWDMKHVDRRAA